MRLSFVILVLMSVSALAPTEAVPAAGSRPYKVIVDPRNPSRALPRRFLAEAFLKKVAEWPDGEAIHPVDLGRDSTTRNAFVEDVLERTTNAVRNYWQQMIFSGRGVPPPELESDDAVVRYVARHRGAIGYVSAHADVSDAKVVSIE
jgi:ABC-type phosphate transport system substrate-binding protein